MNEDKTKYRWVNEEKFIQAKNSFSPWSAPSPKAKPEPIGKTAQQLADEEAYRLKMQLEHEKNLKFDPEYRRMYGDMK